MFTIAGALERGTLDSGGTISVSFPGEATLPACPSPLTEFRSSVCKSVDTYLRGAPCLIFIPERLVPRFVQDCVQPSLVPAAPFPPLPRSLFAVDVHSFSTFLGRIFDAHPSPITLQRASSEAREKRNNRRGYQSFEFFLPKFLKRVNYFEHSQQFGHNVYFFQCMNYSFFTCIFYTDKNQTYSDSIRRPLKYPTPGEWTLPVSVPRDRHWGTNNEVSVRGDRHLAPYGRFVTKERPT